MCPGDIHVFPWGILHENNTSFKHNTPCNACNIISYCALPPGQRALLRRCFSSKLSVCPVGLITTKPWMLLSEEGIFFLCVGEGARKTMVNHGQPNGEKTSLCWAERAVGQRTRSCWNKVSVREIPRLQCSNMLNTLYTHCEFSTTHDEQPQTWSIAHVLERRIWLSFRVFVGGCDCKR